jgi:hypothetical protein
MPCQRHSAAADRREAKLDRPNRRLGAIRDVEFCDHMFDVGLDGADLQAQQVWRRRRARDAPSL